MCFVHYNDILSVIQKLKVDIILIYNSHDAVGQNGLMVLIIQE